MSYVSRATDNAPRAAVVQWPALANRLTRLPPVRHDLCPAGATPSVLRRLKAQLPAWIPATFADGSVRCAQGVTALHLLVLDYDGGARLAEERERWGAYAHAGHTSWSHENAAPKFRIALPLVRPVSVVWWGRCWEWAQRLAPGIDPQTRNPDRIYFLPALKSAASPWVSWVHDAPWLDLDGPDLPPTAVELEQVKRANAMHAQRTRRPFADPTREEARQARLLREDPETRAAFAVRVGADIRQRTSGRVAFGATCPGCGHHSAWFAVDVVRAVGARCNHQNTCGWTGRLEDLQ